MSANRFFAHFQFSNLNFMLVKKNCNDEERYFAPAWEPIYSFFIKVTWLFLENSPVQCLYPHRLQWNLFVQVSVS